SIYSAIQALETSLKSNLTSLDIFTPVLGMRYMSKSHLIIMARDTLRVFMFTSQVYSRSQPIHNVGIIQQGISKEAQDNGSQSLYSCSTKGTKPIKNVGGNNYVI